jgi:hypothetical protein
MSKTETYQRNANEPSETSDFDYFITSDIPIEQIYQMLKLKNMSEKEIDSLVDKIKETRENIRKVVRKFLSKINTTYGHLDIPELIKKGMKHAEKYGLTDAQKKVFINHVLKGDIYNYYSYQNELRYSPMAKFLGFDLMQGQMLRLTPKDHSKLNELHALYDETKYIHADVKNNIYRDCAPEALTGQYDRNKHNVSVSIHPVLAALFLPKVEYLERRMLYTNIARMILARGQAYLKNFNFNLLTNIAPGELDAEFELAHDIAFDPNALEYFKDDSPIDNIIKRFRVQIELYQSILNLRQGRYYSTGYNENDGISGFLRVINSYDWTFFDSPELFHVQDEGTILRKLLAVFSCRPTFTQLSTFGQRYGLGHTSITNLSKTVFVNIPIVNIKLPIDLVGNQVHRISLARALTQTDFFIEHKIVVPKNKSVIYSNQVAFFYANRRYPSVNFNTISGCAGMRYMSIPVSFINQTTINKTVIDFEPRFRIGRDWFDLRSVILLQRPPISGIDVATGCSAAIVVDQNSPSNLFQGHSTAYIHYNPSIASIQYFEGNQPPNHSQYVSNTPITYIDEVTTDPSRIGFRSEAQERGTIFFYVRDQLPATPC